jgi:hypothetical protein
LLTSVTVPVSVAAAVGSNEMFSVADCPGFSVVGNASPEMLNPVPVTDPELIVSAAVPVELMITDCVDVVFTVTFPKATLVEAIVHAAAVAFSCSEVALLTPPAVAVIVAVCAVLTAATVAVNAALVAPAGTVTEAGTATEVLLLASATANPPLGAAAVRLTVHASVAAPVSVPALQARPLKDGVGACCAAAGCSCSVTDIVPLYVFAVMVAVCVVETAATDAVKLTLFDPFGTFTEAGTCTAALLLESFTVRPLPALTVPLIVTVHTSVPAPLMLVEAQEKLPIATAAWEGRPVSSAPPKISTTVAARNTPPPA